jgi:hypothetical protein
MFIAVSPLSVDTPAEPLPYGTIDWPRCRPIRVWLTSWLLPVPVDRRTEIHCVAAFYHDPIELGLLRVFGTNRLRAWVIWEIPISKSAGALDCRS